MVAFHDLHKTSNRNQARTLCRCNFKRGESYQHSPTKVLSPVSLQKIDVKNGAFFTFSWLENWSNAVLRLRKRSKDVSESNILMVSCKVSPFLKGGEITPISRVKYCNTPISRVITNPSYRFLKAIYFGESLLPHL